MQQENNVKKTKAAIKNLGASKTEKAINRATASAPVVADCVGELQNMLGVDVRTRGHSHKERTDDVHELLEHIREMHACEVQEGRSMSKFKNVSQSPFSSIKRRKFCQYVDKLIERRSRGILFPTFDDDEQ